MQSLEPSFHQDLNGDGQVGPPTTVALRVVITAPTDGSTLSGTVTITAECLGQRRRCRRAVLPGWRLLGTEDTTAPYSVSWNTTTATNASHTLLARASDGPATSPIRPRSRSPFTAPTTHRRLRCRPAARTRTSARPSLWCCPPAPSPTSMPATASPTRRPPPTARRFPLG